MVEAIGIVSLILIRLRVIYPIAHAILIATKVERITHESRHLRLETEPTRPSVECFHSRGQYLCKFIGTKESVCIRKEFNSQRIGLGHQHGRRFIVLGHQHGRRDVM